MRAGPGWIEVRGLYKSFRGRSGEIPVPVLGGVDVQARAGEFVAILGPSGCGKSTLLSCLAGFERWDRGTITVDGVSVTGPSRRRVLVFQEPSIFPWLTVADNIAFGLSRRLPAAEREAIVQHQLALVGLEGFAGALPSELSGGMKQRVELARALAVDPDVLYLDEPFGALDALSRLELRREMGRLQRQTRKTCLLVTHDVEEACMLADRVAVLGRRPAAIETVVDIPLSHPRSPDDPELRALQRRLYAALGVERAV